MLSLTTALPPSVNHLYATIRGRRVLSADGRAYKQALGLQALAAASEQGFAVDDAQRLALTIRLHYPDRRRHDLSNAVKCLEDGIAEALGFDDCRIDRLLVERGAIDKVAPRCEVRLELLGVNDLL